MAKMYYNEQEAAEKLNVTEAELLEKVRTKELRAYADGSNKMFKVAEVDSLAPQAPAAPLSGESDIQLSPVEMSGTHAPLSLADTRDATSVTDAADTSNDTVMTSEGISIFDDEDLEIEPADPMAKTQIAPSLEEGMGLEGLSSGGSGLLDLTREGDDTSLGAEVLDHIDMESGEMPSVESVADGLAEEVAQAAPPIMDISEAAMGYDPAAAMFTGVAVAGGIVSILMGLIAVSMMTGRAPGYIETLAGKIPMVAGVAVGVLVVAALVGHLVGKKGATAAN